LLKTKNAEFVITKNTLLLRALGEFLHLDKPDLDLSGQTATLFSYEDEVEPLKLLIKFAKTNSMPALKVGFMKSVKTSLDDLNRLVKLPNRTILLSQLVGQMKSPLNRLHRTLNWNLQQLVFALSAIKDKKLIRLPR
ncbi:MAG: 50S ribosomal protein L10, partial [uncultured bacterium]